MERFRIEQARAFETYGRAVAAAQHLETSVVELIALKTMPDLTGADKDQEWTFVVREFLKMEPLLIFNSFIECYDVPSDLSNRLRRAVGIRDLLVRQYLWEKESSLYTAQGSKELQKELDETLHLFTGLSAEVSSHAQRHLPSLKRAKEFVSRLLQTIQESRSE